jgi:hypothetical protein
MQVYFSIMDKKVGNLFREGATEHVKVTVKSALHNSELMYNADLCQ